MSDLEKFRTLYKLKSVYRMTSVDNRKESTAEHTWSCLMLADYVLSKSDIDIDRLKVYELLMYHDIVEIHAGDSPLDPNNEITDQKERETASFNRLSEELPEALSEKYKQLYEEFESMQTLESRFAKAIDKLDAQIQELDYKNDWKGWTEKFLRDKLTKYYIEFPVIIGLFEEFLKYARDNGFFDQ